MWVWLERRCGVNRAGCVWISCLAAALLPNPSSVRTSLVSYTQHCGSSSLLHGHALCLLSLPTWTGLSCYGQGECIHFSTVASVSLPVTSHLPGMPAFFPAESQTFWVLGGRGIIKGPSWLLSCSACLGGSSSRSVFCGATLSVLGACVLLFPGIGCESLTDQKSSAPKSYSPQYSLESHISLLLFSIHFSRDLSR